MTELVEVIAIVRTAMLERLVHVLRDAGVPRLTVTPIHAIGRGVDPAAARLSVDEGVPYSAKSKVEFVCRGEKSAMYTELICRGAATGRQGDGIVYLRPVLGVTKIRTGAEGRVALD